MATITDRRRMLEEIVAILVDRDWWGDRVRIRESADSIPDEFAVPFVIVHPLEAEFEPKSSAQTWMMFSVGITVYADLTEPEWSLKSYGDGTAMGLVELQDDVFQAFKRGSLNGLVSFTFCTRHGEAVPVAYRAGEAEHAALRATSQIQVRNYEYG